MYLMKKSFLGFLVIIMLTPLLTCVMPFCPMQTAMAKEQKPCHQSMVEDTESNAPMMVKDCMGVEFSSSYNVDNVPPDQSIDFIDYAWTDAFATNNVSQKSAKTIRGPPYDVRPQYLNDHNLYLTTQRLRV